MENIWIRIRSGMGKIRIRDKHPGSATLKKRRGGRVRVCGLPGVPHELEYGGLLAGVPGVEGESAVLEVFDARES
jgi:hypothetical protein